MFFNKLSAYTVTVSILISSTQGFAQQYPPGSMPPGSIPGLIPGAPGGFILPVQPSAPVDSALTIALKMASVEPNPQQLDLYIDQAVVAVDKENITPDFKAKLKDMLVKARAMVAVTSGDENYKGKIYLVNMALKQLSVGRMDNEIGINPPTKIISPVGDVLGQALNMDNNMLYRYLIGTGITKIDYAAMNTQLRNKYPFMSNDELSEIIINRTMKSSALISAGSSSIALLDLQFPGAGSALAIPASMFDIHFTFKRQAMMVLQLADLYNYELSTVDREVDTTVILALVLVGTKAIDPIVFKASRAILGIKSGALKLAQVPFLTKLWEKLGWAAGIKTASENVAKEVAEQVEVKGFAAAKGPIIGIAVNAILTGAFSKTLGEVTKRWFRTSREEQVKRAYDALFVAEIRDGIFKLLISSIAFARPALQELNINDTSDKELGVLRNLANRANVTPQKNPEAFQRMMDELRNFNTIPVSYMSNLGKQASHLREAIADMILEVQLLKGDRSPADVQIFKKVQNEILGLTGDRYDQRFAQLEAYIQKYKKYPTYGSSIAGIF